MDPSPRRPGQGLDEEILRRLCLEITEKKLKEGLIQDAECRYQEERIKAYFSGPQGEGFVLEESLPASNPAESSGRFPATTNAPLSSSASTPAIRSQTAAGHSQVQQCGDQQHHPTQHNVPSIPAPVLSTNRSRSQPSMSSNSRAAAEARQAAAAAVRAARQEKQKQRQGRSGNRAEPSSTDHLRNFGVKTDSQGHYITRGSTRVKLKKVTKIHCGNLEKRGRSTLSNWKPRYFQLDFHLRTPHNNLYYGVLLYSSIGRGTGRHRGEVYIHYNTEVRAEKDTDRHTHCFCVATHGQKPLVASAATASERDAWILQISKVIRCLKALHREEGDINSARASFRRQRSAKYCRDLARAVTTALLCEAEAHPPSKCADPANNSTTYSPEDNCSVSCTLNDSSWVLTSHQCKWFTFFRRELFGLLETDFRHSFQGLKGTSGDGGRSGSVFFFTTDKRYMLKSINGEEVYVLRSMMLKYLDYMRTNRHSLLPKLLGLFELRPHSSSAGTNGSSGSSGSSSSSKGKGMMLVCMESCFSSNLPIHEIYDLKGSSVDRHVDLTKERNDSGDKDAKASKLIEGKFIKCTLKDTNWTQRGRAIHIGTHRRELIKQIYDDTRFLQSCKIMDYSLLVGMHVGYDGPLDDETRRALVDRSWEYREDSGNDHSRSSFWSTGLFRGGYLSKPATVGPPSTFNRSNPHLTTLRRHRSASSGDGSTETPEVAGAEGGIAETTQSDYSGLDIPFAQPVEEHDLSPPRGSDVYGGSTPAASFADPTCGPYDIFYLGIIDIFQTYNNKKRMESVAKNVKIRVVQAPMRLINQKKMDTNISAVEPGQYQERFMKFIKREVIPRPPSLLIPEDEDQRLFLMRCMQFQGEIQEFMKNNLAQHFRPGDFRRRASHLARQGTASALAMSVLAMGGNPSADGQVPTAQFASADVMHAPRLSRRASGLAIDQDQLHRLSRQNSDPEAAKIVDGE